MQRLALFLAMPNEIFSYPAAPQRPGVRKPPLAPRSTPTPTQSARRHWYTRWWIWTLAALVVIALAGILALREVGNWLVVEDPIAPADVAVVLSGRMPSRAEEAAKLFKQGLIPEIWITRPADPSQTLRALDIDFIGEAFYNQKVLISLGVPFEKVRVLDQTIFNTQDEIEEVARAARAENLQRVILVTSMPHTRRTRLIWRKLIGSDPAVIVHFTRSDPYDGAHWWRSTSDALDVVREVLGIANAWTGFPLKHLSPQS
jgi:uncharacterized SAM-binding protein YcdF (DUF218 family)